MKKAAFFIIVIIVLVVLLFKKTLLSPSPTPSPTPTISNRPIPTKSINSADNTKYKILDTKYSVFIPYWSLPTDSNKIVLPNVTSNQSLVNSYIYFGVTPTTTGINKEEPGYKNLNSFVTIAENHKKILAIRLTNSVVTNTILEDTAQNQEKIIDETITIAQQNDFAGLLLDLEVSGLPTEKLKGEITTFVRRFSIASTSAKLSFSITLYGDVFYRARPYDIGAIEPYVDSFYIMAYDLHKAAGDPGPNFPLSGEATIGYDLHHLYTDVSKVVDSKKLTVIFGLYGYDWIVDEQKRPIKPAKSIPLSQIREQFLNTCKVKNCVVRRDGAAAETEIDYIDNYTNYHIIWFEDEESVRQKSAFLKKNGVNSFSFWAWGYY